MTRLALIVALLALALPASASAASYPGEHPAPQLDVDAAQVAQDFWRARGVDATQRCPGGITVLEAPDLSGPDIPAGAVAMGRGWDCRVWILSDVGDSFQSKRRGVCTVLVHEIGHALGLQHSETGIMAPQLSMMLEDTPWACRRWARASARAARARYRSRHDATH